MKKKQFAFWKWRITQETKKNENEVSFSREYDEENSFYNKFIIKAIINRTTFIKDNKKIV